MQRGLNIAKSDIQINPKDIESRSFPGQEPVTADSANRRIDYSTLSSDQRLKLRSYFVLSYEASFQTFPPHNKRGWHN